LFALAVLAGCSFDPRTDNTPPPSDTALPDAATDGAQQVVDAGDPDATPRDLCLQDIAACTDANGVCVNGTCTITQPTTGGVTCPNGMPCKVNCSTAENSCQSGLVRCAGATTCDVTCGGASACQDNGVDCGSATVCTVLCDGASACQHGVNGQDRAILCRGSDCTVTCKGSGSTCQDGIDPGSGSCTSHCCDGACGGKTCAPNNDDVCP
jgi:hypothetical protein